MTREEAIDILECRKDGNAVEALAIAIEALKAEPCADCVSRRDAINACFDGWNKDYKEIAYDIRKLPTVTPAEKVGHWYKKPHEICYTCDQCRTTNASGVKYDFCPHCGACMNEGGEG